MLIQGDSSFTTINGHIDLGDGTYLFRTPGLTLAQTYDLYQTEGIGATTREQYYFDSVSIGGQYAVVREIAGTNSLDGAMSATLYLARPPCSTGSCSGLASIVYRTGDGVNFSFGDYVGSTESGYLNGREFHQVFSFEGDNYRFFGDEPNSPDEHVFAEGVLTSDQSFAVPEPATGTLLAAALLIFAAMSWFRSGRSCSKSDATGGSGGPIMLSPSGADPRTAPRRVQRH